LNNIDFLKELKFFNENPHKTEVIDKSFVVGLFFTEAMFFIPILSWLEATEFLKSIVITLCIASAIGFYCYINKKNKRYESFKNSIYTENPSDLFGNLSSPDVVYYLDEIKRELVDYYGIRGLAAVSICSRINNPYIKEQRLKRESAKKMIDEIEAIQKTI
jgi:hypothetical protein